MLIDKEVICTTFIKVMRRLQFTTVHFGENSV